MAKAERARLGATQADVPTDFLEACKTYQIKTKAKGLIHFDPAIWHDAQRRFNAERTGRDIILKARQLGITTAEALRGLHQCQTRQSWNTAIVIHDRDEADKLFDIIRLARGDGAEKLQREQARIITLASTQSSISITEAGSTRRVAQKKGRSGTIHRLHATEIAFWAEALTSMTGLLGAVPDNGEVLLESTANGAGGYFYDLVQEAREGKGRYKLHFYPWWQHAAYRLDLPEGFDPRPVDEWEQKLLGCNVDANQLAWWRAKVASLTLDKALQEFPIDVDTCFRASGRLYLDPADIDALKRGVRDPLRLHELRHEGLPLGAAKIYAGPLPNIRYSIGADLSEGTGRDGHAATVVRDDTCETVATLASDSIDPGDFGLALAGLGAFYNLAVIAPERNNHGHTALRALDAEAAYPNVYIHTDGKPGWLTSQVTRPVMFDEWRDGVHKGLLSTPDGATAAEAGTLVIDPRGRPEARGKGREDGCRDDRIVSWAIACQIRGAGKTDTMATAEHENYATHGIDDYF